MSNTIALSIEQYKNFEMLTVMYKVILDRVLAMDNKLNSDPSIKDYYDTYFKAIDTIKITESARGDLRWFFGK